MPPRQRQFEDLVAQLRGDSPDPDRQSLWPALLADQWTACRDGVEPAARPPRPAALHRGA